MTTVGEHVVTDLIGFGIDFGLKRAASRTWKRLYRVGHGVAMGGITVPGFEGQHLSHPVVYEAVRCFYAGIEAEHVTHLEYKATLPHFLRQQLYFFDGDSERLFTKNMLAGGEGLESSRDVKWVGDRDDDRIHDRVCQHVVIVEVNALRTVEFTELLSQGFICVTDRAEENVSSLLRG